jgi:hypothetical protein
VGSIPLPNFVLGRVVSFIAGASIMVDYLR